MKSSNGSASEISFPFRFHVLFRLPNALAGVRPSNSKVVVRSATGDSPSIFEAVFGPWRVRTPLYNIASAEVTGPYFWPKVIGGAHLSLKDLGLTFGTNAHRGVCIRFDQPVHGIEPFGLIRHQGLTVTVEDPAGLAELLDRASSERARTHIVIEEADVAELSEEVDLELQSLTASQLRDHAQSRGISTTSRMSKLDLIRALESE